MTVQTWLKQEFPENQLFWVFARRNSDNIQDLHQATDIILLLCASHIKEAEKKMNNTTIPKTDSIKELAHFWDTMT